jgi:hypothetical protein
VGTGEGTGVGVGVGVGTGLGTGGTGDGVGTGGGTGVGAGAGPGLGDGGVGEGTGDGVGELLQYHCGLAAPTTGAVVLPWLLMICCIVPSPLRHTPSGDSKELSRAVGHKIPLCIVTG